MNRPLSIAVCLLWIMAVPAWCGEWSSFRGPEGSGISTAKDVPIRWGAEENIKWKVALPAKGNGSPIISAGRVFIQYAEDEGKQRGLACFDLDSGELLWTRTVPFDAVERVHRSNDHSPATPAANGKLVVVWHGSAGVYCYDFAGTLRWRTELGEFLHIWGFASSPVIYGDLVLLNCGPGERSFVTALRLDNGRQMWQADEPGGSTGEGEGDARVLVGSWSTPVVANVEGEDQVIVSLPTRVAAFAPRTGKELWSCDGLSNMPKGDVVYASPSLGPTFGVALGGYGGPAMGFQLGGAGNVTETNRLWHHTSDTPQRIGSGVVVGRHMFIVNSPGVAQCLDAETGEELWKARVPGGAIWGSTVMADGHLYATNQKGTTNVFAANPEKFELLASNELGEGPVNATPAFADGRIVLRTAESLYLVSEQ